MLPTANWDRSCLCFTVPSLSPDADVYASLCGGTMLVFSPSQTQVPVASEAFLLLPVPHAGRNVNL